MGISFVYHIAPWSHCCWNLDVQILSVHVVRVAQSCLTLCDPMDYTICGILQARILEWVASPFSRGSSQHRDQTRSPALQAESLPAEPWGKLKNTGVGVPSLLQGTFPAQESNRGLLQCRQILYQLRHQGSPDSNSKDLGEVSKP